MQPLLITAYDSLTHAIEKVEKKKPEKEKKTTFCPST